MVKNKKKKREWAESYFPITDEDLESVDRFGFYEADGRYIFRRVKKDDIIYMGISNFTMQILFLVKGQNAKRIICLTNSDGYSVTADFGIEELISMDKFKLKTERQGDFLFQGSASDLARIKSKLFKSEKHSQEIDYAGHQKGVFALSNGVYNYETNTFIELNEHGMVSLEDKNYFLSLHSPDDGDAGLMKMLMHRPSTVSFETWSSRFISVYGDNGKIGLAFGLAAVFVDVVKEATSGKMPMLFSFGQKGSGKTTLTTSLLCLFGERREPPKLEGRSTPKSYIRLLAQVSNFVIGIDEYKNNIHPEFIGMLKGVHDGAGYERAKMDNSNKTISTPIRSTILVSGQEIPNCEPALFSRFLLLEFQTLKNIPQLQRDAYDALVSMENGGITNVLFEILSKRNHFKEKYRDMFIESRAELRKLYDGSETIDRQILIGASIIAAAKTLESVLKLPFPSTELTTLVSAAINRQTALMSTADETQQFWETVAMLLSQKQICNEKEIRFKAIAFTQKGDEKPIYNAGWVCIRLKYIYPLYRERLVRQNMKPLDSGTLEQYLKASAAWDLKESAKSQRFKLAGNPTNALCFSQKELVRNYDVDLTEHAPIEIIEPA